MRDGAGSGPARRGGGDDVTRAEHFSVVVLMGGDSPEREISLATGRAVADALCEAGHEVTAFDLERPDDVLALVDDLRAADVVFPALHGGWGEDGRLQGVLSLLGVTYALSGPAACAVAMDKALCKRVMRGADIPTPDWLLVAWDHARETGPDPDELARRVDDALGFPAVVKPNADGSSVGVAVVADADELAAAVVAVADRGQDVLVERYVPGRELTATILLGRRLPLVEIVPREGFYDYEHKYTAGASEYLCPAPVHSPLYERIAADARRLYELVGCRGVARADVRLDGDTYAFLELNTIPGMTPTSLVPKAAATVGIAFPDLLTDLCRDAYRRRPGQGDRS